MLLFGKIYSQPLSFLHIGVTDGLSQSSVYGIFQDSKGLMWFGTADGLNRYDGREMKLYRCAPNKKLRGNGNFFGYTICEDKGGDLWFSGRDGIIKYDYHHDELFRFFPDNDTVNFSRLIEILCITPEQDLWFWSRGDAFYCYNIISKKLSVVKISDPSLPREKTFYRNAKSDGKGIIWYSLFKGLGSFDTKTQNFRSHLEACFSENSIPLIADFLFEPSGELILSCGNSIVRFSPIQNQIKILLKDDLHSSYNALTRDTQGNIWIGSLNNGLEMLNEVTGEKKVYMHDKNNPQSIASNIVTNLFIDHSQNLWIGLDGEGLCRMDLKPVKFNHYRIDDVSGWKFSTNFMKAIYVDSADKIWIGTHDGEIGRAHV